MSNASEPEKPEVLADGMMSVADVVAFSKLNRAEIYSAMARGELKSYRFGRRRLLAKVDLVAWLKAHLVAVN